MRLAIEAPLNACRTITLELVSIDRSNQPPVSFLANEETAGRAEPEPAVHHPGHTD
jgi:hypothetical protein